MSENNNILRQPFGLNIKFPQRTLQQGKETIQHQVEGVLDPLFKFVEENQSVFSGKVADEIERYNLMSYNTGVALRMSQPEKTFDVKG